MATKKEKWDGKSRVSNDLYRKNFDDIFKKEQDELNESYKQAEENGVMLRKMWSTENDDSVRETHQELDGVTVKAGEDFVTSGGDASPSPANFGIESEDVNCRCTMEAIVAKE